MRTKGSENVRKFLCQSVPLLWLGILCSFTLADVGNGWDFWGARLAVGRLCYYSREKTTITWTWVLGVDNASEEQEACLREKGKGNQMDLLTCYYGR